MNPQVVGIDELGGTYVFDIRTSNRTLKLNRFFWNMIRAEARNEYIEDAELSMTQAGLTDDEKDMIRRLDWIGLVRYGANFFVLEKFARVVKTPNLVVYALMRGQSFEDFMQTRQVPTMR
ncbi:protocatechuate 3,4-dioxygenase [Duganella sp. FT135W]|uniref:Protocatechuate 3,4-dioxygenase n=1 Tax=Duganella flavida TaxID=2692175 RepID=A0A6L8KFS2_9BURK|nr:protocatechuate 3,4-dioxygenase [Duganella flavida]MYM26289.1 protocatechuate 3,4-dioxygenase [Duganella flavida]